MVKRKTTTEFVSEARAKHGRKYDYSSVEYLNNSTKVSVGCLKCGEPFLIRPFQHLQGSGCPKCWVFRRRGKRKKRTTASFIEEARKVHGDKFDYSKVDYTNSQRKVTIGCMSCGLVFEQLANSHLRGIGCPTCSAREGGRKRAAKAAATFEQRAREVHGDAYGYEHVEYRSNQKPVKIHCRSCDSVFEQNPDNHLAGKGCSTCGTVRRARTRTKSTSQFIDEAIKVYGPNVFTYEDTEYIVSHEHVTIRCCACDRTFNRTPASHLQNHACPFCSFGNTISKAETLWLDSIGVPERQYRIRLPSGRLLRVDGYDPSTNTVYSFLGSFWHADPRKCSPDDNHPVIGRRNKDIHQETLDRLASLQEAGFQVVFIWEEDWKTTLNP